MPGSRSRSNDGTIREVKFVSVDTHPAKNALVITYELLVSAADHQGRVALASKRNQLQAVISQLDKLDGPAGSPGELLVDLRDLSSQVMRKCPVALPNDIEDEVQLHLAYLVKRRQAQLLELADPNQRSASAYSTRMAMRPPTTGRRSANSTRKLPRPESRLAGETGDDVHLWMLSKHQQYDDYNDEMQLDLLAWLDDFLSLDETTSEPKGQSMSTKELDTIIEGLYGDHDERLAALTRLRHLSKSDDHLFSIASNRLLIFAFVRLLRDSLASGGELAGKSPSQKQQSQLVLRILFILLRLTSYQDLYEVAFERQHELAAVELDQTLVESLEQQAKQLLLDHRRDPKQFDAASCVEWHYTLAANLALLVNLLRIDLNGELQEPGLVHSRLLLSSLSAVGEPDRRLLLSLTVLLQLLCKQQFESRLRSEISTERLEQIIKPLELLLACLKHLSVFKEFVTLLLLPGSLAGGTSQLLLDTLIGFLHTLQLARPASGKAAAAATAVAASREPISLLSERHLLNKLYLLELNTISLIDNFLLERRLKARAVRGSPQLLKCLLRSLVLFLASPSASNKGKTDRQQQHVSLVAFERSQVLLEPLRGLYELSCLQPIRQEILSSRVATGCLLEYLLAVDGDLCEQMRRRKQQQHQHYATGAISETLEATLSGELAFEARTVSELVLCIWINLSCHRAAPMYREQPSELLARHLDFAVDIASLQSIRAGPYGELEVLAFLQAKLLRNLTQFLPFKLCEDKNWLCSLYCKLAKETLSTISAGNATHVAFLVERLASLTNMLGNESPALYLLEADHEAAKLSWQMLEQLLLRFEASRENDYDGQEDDMLLASILYLASVASCQELCKQAQSSELFARTIQASEAILARKTQDASLVSGSLLATSKMMLHAGFLTQLMSTWPVSHLVGQLCELTLSPSEPLARSANYLLERLKQLNSTTCERRFETFNQKWLAAIRVARGELLADGVVAVQDNNNNNIDDDEQQAFGDAAEVELDGFSEQSGSNVTDFQELEADEDEEEGLSFALGANGDDDDGSPDANVIDANSMIGHLVAAAKRPAG